MGLIFLLLVWNVMILSFKRVFKKRNYNYKILFHLLYSFKSIWFFIFLCLLQIGGFLQFLTPIKLIARHDITEILLKVALNTIIPWIFHVIISIITLILGYELCSLLNTLPWLTCRTEITELFLYSNMCLSIVLADLSCSVTSI